MITFFTYSFPWTRCWNFRKPLFGFLSSWCRCRGWNRWSGYSFLCSAFPLLFGLNLFFLPLVLSRMRSRWPGFVVDFWNLWRGRPAVLDALALRAVAMAWNGLHTSDVDGSTLNLEPTANFEWAYALLESMIPKGLLYHHKHSSQPVAPQSDQLSKLDSSWGCVGCPHQLSPRWFYSLPQIYWPISQRVWYFVDNTEFIEWFDLLQIMKYVSAGKARRLNHSWNHWVHSTSKSEAWLLGSGCFDSFFVQALSLDNVVHIRSGQAMRCHFVHRLQMQQRTFSLLQAFDMVEWIRHIFEWSSKFDLNDISEWNNQLKYSMNTLVLTEWLREIGPQRLCYCLLGVHLGWGHLASYWWRILCQIWNIHFCLCMIEVGIGKLESLDPILVWLTKQGSSILVLETIGQLQ